MSALKSPLYLPSLVKKYLMALTGLILALFVMGHMLGNLQFFLGPDAINAYALHLHSLPFHPFSLYGIRLFLLACLVVHVAMAILLYKENRAARPEGYANSKPQVSTLSSRLMPVSGLVLLGYIIFHILHFTVRVVPENYNETIPMDAIAMHGGQTAYFFDVYAMMVKGFSVAWVSLFYIVAVGLLCVHLTHGVSSMFQSLGLRNETWRYRLDWIATGYGWIVFLGFAMIPASVLLFGVGQDYLAEVTANPPHIPVEVLEHYSH